MTSTPPFFLKSLEVNVKVWRADDSYGVYSLQPCSKTAIDTFNKEI